MIQRSWWEENLVWLVGAVLLVLYVAILPTNITWANYGGDGGDFLAAILSGGVPHPSGYPTYTLLGSLFQHLPFGTPPWKAALLSAVPAAIAAAWAGLWVQRQLFANERMGTLAGVVAALSWGTAPLFVSQAVIVEVHGLQSLTLVAWLWWFSMLGSAAPPWKVFLLSIAVGLSLGNHMTILLLAPAALWFAYQAYRGGKKLSFLMLQLAFVVCAAGVVYGALALRASQNPPVNWGGAQTWEGMLWLVSGKAYSGFVAGSPPVLILERISAWAGLLIHQFWAPGIVAAAWGVVQEPRGRIPTHYYWLLLWIFASSSIFAILYNTADSLIYLIPALFPAAVWMGSAAVSLWATTYRGKPLGKALVLILVATLITHLPFTLKEVDPRHDTRAENYLSFAQDTLPPNAIVLTASDADTFPIWYLHFGLKQQPDWRVVVLPLTQSNWYIQSLASTYPDLSLPAPGYDWQSEFKQANPNRPFCLVSQAANTFNEFEISCDP